MVPSSSDPSCSVSASEFVHDLVTQGVTFARGVTDSVLVGIERELEFCGAIDTKRCACEAQAAAEVAGNVLFDDGISLLYLQNSGLGAVLDPLTSLWPVPCLMLVTWRGRPGVADASQHLRMGEATVPVLDAVGVESVVLERSVWRSQLDEAVSAVRDGSRTVALLAPPGFFGVTSFISREPVGLLSDVDVMERVLSAVGPDDVVVTSVGNVSKLFGKVRGERDVLWLPVAGAMGSTFPVAASVARKMPASRVFCVEGDGSAAMMLSSRLSVCQRVPSNLRHVIIANGRYSTFDGNLGVRTESLLSTLWAMPSAGMEEVWDSTGLISALRAMSVADSFCCVVVRTSGYGGPALEAVDFDACVARFREGCRR